MDPIWYIGGVLVIVIGVVVAVAVLEKKRREALERVAGEIGLTFHGKDDRGIRAPLEALPLFQRGSSRRFRNVMSGTIGDLEAYIFDYRYTIRRGRNSSTYSQSVVAFQMKAYTLPEFQLSREGMFHKLGAMLGFDDIDFESHPQFSRTFHLKGRDEEAIRGFFTDDVIRAIGDLKINVEAAGAWLIVYRASKRSKPDEVGNLLDTAFTIVNAMT